MTRNGTSEMWEFTYNADGLRTQRKNTVTNRTYNYTYLGDQLTHMTVDGHTMYFTYDASGTPLNLVYDGYKFYYITNLQGDVISIVDGNGTEFVRYTYDAWGKILKTEGSATNLRYYNPLRYRGYVYDTETELYYLQSRYYDPEMGRFINADGFTSTGQGVLGNNMFAYCLNNPINMDDPCGHCSKFLGFLWKIDCKSPTCTTSKSYVKPSPPVSPIGSYSNAKGNTIGNVYIIQPSQLTDMTNAKEKNDVVIIDRRTEPNPTMQVQNSHTISNKKQQAQICQLMLDYNKAAPVEPGWNRTLDSMLIEWKAHNHGYRGRLVISIIKDDAKERLAHVDFDNAAEGLGYWDFLGK